jgi:hypothetical protein
MIRAAAWRRLPIAAGRSRNLCNLPRAASFYGRRFKGSRFQPALARCQPLNKWPLVRWRQAVSSRAETHRRGRRWLWRRRAGMDRTWLIFGGQKKNPPA